MNWNQTGMPAALVSRLGQKRELAEFKSVLNDARNHILQPVDVEAMAQDLVQSGGREFVELLRELTTALSNAERNLEESNRRYERLVADLASRGVSLEDECMARRETDRSLNEPPKESSSEESKSAADAQAEWEEWDRRFRALLG